LAGNFLFTAFGRQRYKGSLSALAGWHSLQHDHGNFLIQECRRLADRKNRAPKN
jgi:hypothetical protein